MSDNQLNQIFSHYTPILYNAAKRMIDKRHSQYEDKVQDLIVLAYEEFTRKASEGKIMELPLVIHFMKLRKPEVQMEMRGYSRTNKTDVFNKRNYYEGKMELYSIDNPVFDGEGDTYADIICDANDAESKICFEMDVYQKVSELTENERSIIEKKVSGFDDAEIAQALSVHPQAVKNTLTRIANKFMPKTQRQFELQFFS